MAEREPDSDSDQSYYSDGENNAPDCGTTSQQKARFLKFSKLLRQNEADGYPPDELLKDGEELGKAYSQFYCAWINASVQFDHLLESHGQTIVQGRRMTYKFAAHKKRSAKNLWEKTCSLFDHFEELGRISFAAWGIRLNYNNVEFKGFHYEHIDRQQNRSRGEVYDYVIS